MEYFTRHFEDAEASVAFFDAGRQEAHAIIRLACAGKPFSRQLETLLSAASALTAELGLDPVFKRFFLSDASNQTSYFPALSDCATSLIQQPPLDGTKVGLLVIYQADARFESKGRGLWISPRGQMWLGDDSEVKASSSRAMTISYLDRLAGELSRRGASLKDHCVRTWFFVRDVDNNYAGVVTGRNEIFERHGLTASTHFIASTGIAGQSADPSRLVEFNACADLRIVPGQMTYLYGKTHLNPTYEYGVAFERAVRVDYADRRHIYVSGTASIDSNGAIVAPGDIVAQTGRMIENIGVLLSEGECGWADVAHLIVYLRDIADCRVVDDIFSRRFPLIPRIIVLAPVCRPGWLIETECMAVRRQESSCYDPF